MPKKMLKEMSDTLAMPLAKKSKPDNHTIDVQNILNEINTNQNQNADSTLQVIPITMDDTDDDMLIQLIQNTENLTNITI